MSLGQEVRHPSSLTRLNIDNACPEKDGPFLKTQKDRLLIRISVMRTRRSLRKVWMALLHLYNMVNSSIRVLLLDPFEPGQGEK